MIRAIDLGEIPDSIVREAKRYRLLFSKREGAHYFGGFLDGELVCFTCLVVNKNRTGRIKSNYTVEGYRRRGYFTLLNKYCLDYARLRGLRRISLNCLEDSAGIHLRQGARLWKRTRHLYWMVYEEGSF